MYNDIDSGLGALLLYAVEQISVACANGGEMALSIGIQHMR